jgi:hypothetical protein
MAASELIQSLGLDAASENVTKSATLPGVSLHRYPGMALAGGYQASSFEFRMVREHLSVLTVYIRPNPCLHFSQLRDKYGPLETIGASADLGIWIYARQLKHGRLYVHTLPPDDTGRRCVVAVRYGTS